MNEKLNSKQLNALANALLTLKSRDEIYSFFEDLCTIAEIKAMAQRFEVAQLLTNGIPYAEIVEKTGVSSATISRVNRCLVYGADGYKTAIARLSEKEEN